MCWITVSPEIQDPKKHCGSRVYPYHNSGRNTKKSRKTPKELRNILYIIYMYSKKFPSKHFDFLFRANWLLWIIKKGMQDLNGILKSYPIFGVMSKWSPLFSRFLRAPAGGRICSYWLEKLKKQIKINLGIIMYFVPRCAGRPKKRVKYFFFCFFFLYFFISFTKTTDLERNKTTNSFEISSSRWKIITNLFFSTITRTKQFLRTVDQYNYDIFITRQNWNFLHTGMYLGHFPKQFGKFWGKYFYIRRFYITYQNKRNRSKTLQVIAILKYAWTP